MRLSVLLCFGALLVFLSSCDEPSPQPDPSGSGKDSIVNQLDAVLDRVLIICEGGFGQSNSSVTQYDKKEFTLLPSAFQFINDYNPGDVLQTSVTIDDKLYLILNGSAKIEVTDPYSLVSEAPIQGLVSPRELIWTEDGMKAYASNLYSDGVQIVNLETKTITGTIDINGWSEGMLKVDDKIYVCRANGDKVIVIDIATDSVVDSIEVTAGPTDIVQDAIGNIWVLSNGNFGEAVPMLSKLSSDSSAVIATFSIPEPWSYFMSLCINGEGDQLYVLNGSVYTMFTTDSEIDSDPFIDTGIPYYGIGVDPENGDVYVADANDFVTIGVVERYSYSGTLIDEFQVGVAPNGFHFGK